MFLVNSRLGLVSAATSGSGSKSRHPSVAPLLPKLRGHFAEFLNQSYLERLSILYLTTCVGLGYGHLCHLLEAFLGSMGSRTSPHGSASCLRVDGRRICLPTPLRTYPRSTIAWVALPFSVTPLLTYYAVGRTPKGA